MELEIINLTLGPKSFSEIDAPGPNSDVWRKVEKSYRKSVQVKLRERHLARVLYS